MKKSIKESLKKGEYYVWTVHFSDGESKKVKITSDYIGQAELEKHFGKPVSKIDYNFGIQGGEYQFDQAAADEYHRQQDELEKRTKGDVWEGSMGGINRSRPAQDVSYEKVLDDDKSENEMDNLKTDNLNEIFQEVCEKWMQEKGVDEAMTRWGGYSSDEKKAGALAKAPKGSMMGSDKTRFKELVQDTIATHGLKWAYDYYVKKHGLPTRHFEIFAGVEPGHFDLTTDVEDPVNKNMAFGEPTSPMKGSVKKPFNQIVQDAIKAKGLDWARDYFVNKKGIPEWEFNIFAKQKPTGLGTK